MPSEQMTRTQRLAGVPVLIEQPYRVPMADVDAAQVLYYASPYRWKEMLFTQWLAQTGRPLVTLLHDGQGFPCVASSARYLCPVRLDDVVDLVLVGERVGRTSLGLRLDAYLPSGRLAVIVETANVWLERSDDGDSAPAPVPGWIRDAFTSPASV